jgi:hypothetical protein
VQYEKRNPRPSFNGAYSVNLEYVHQEGVRMIDDGAEHATGRRAHRRYSGRCATTAV